MAVVSPSAEALAETVAVVAFGALMEASELWRGHPMLQQWRLHREPGHPLALMLLHPGAEQLGTDNFGDLMATPQRGTTCRVIRMTRRVGGGGPAAAAIEDKHHGTAACVKLGPK